MTFNWRAYIFNLFIALDQLLNAVLLGDPDETISSRIAKNPGHPIGDFVGAILEWIDPGHLAKSVEWDEGRMELKGWVRPNKPLAPDTPPSAAELE